jgi:general secretion pathway protein D
MTPDQMPDLGSYITHVVQLKYTKPQEMVPVLQPFAKMQNSILPIDSSQILVLRDFAENVKRMLELIREIDVAIPAEFISEVIPIKYAKAAEIASALNSLSSGGGGATVGGGGGGGGTTTRSTRSTGGFGRGGYGGGMGGMGYGGGSGYGGYGGMGGGVTPYGSSASTFGSGASTTGAGSTFTDRLRNIITKASSSGEITVLGQTKMIADERTNSLLIYASREDMKTIKEIVAKLDVVLAQVLIEAVIIQVSLDDSRQLGFSYIQQRASESGNFTGIGAINPGQAIRQADFLPIGGTNGGTSLGGGLTYLARFGGDLDVTVTALASDSRAKILQRPRIQTSHNEPAHLFVGESRPYPTGSYYGGGAYGGYSSIQAVPIGVTLEVTPLINPDGLVVMDIAQDIQSMNGEVKIDNVGNVPVTSQKSATAKVSVRDRDTIMLGGLIETTKSKTADGVPYLKDIPLLGYLFRSSSAREVRNELIVLIRPTVLPTPEVAALAAKAVKDEMPLVRRAEAEITADEVRRNRIIEQELQAMEKENNSNPDTPKP